MLMRSPLARDRRQPPGFIRPCQPVLAAKGPAGDGWLHELKHDGFRIVHKDGGDVRLWSRNGRDWSVEFAAISAAALVIPFARIVLDGEAVAHCPEGLPDFLASWAALAALQHLATPLTSCTSAKTICGGWSWSSAAACC
jgi:ATP-dependent DNA ligase